MAKFILRFLIWSGLLLLLLVAALVFWARQPLELGQKPLELTITSGTTLSAITRQMADAGLPVFPLAMQLLARTTGRATRLKAGTYQFADGITPLGLLAKMERGDVMQFSLVIPEGWTVHQMRIAIAANTNLKQLTANWSDTMLANTVGINQPSAEGLFFPDTYLFSRGTPDLEIFKRAFAMQQRHLNEAWNAKPADYPLTSPYELLILASIIEKETGRDEDRPQVAAVFMNRLKRGMLLQTDPAVIYGMGDRYNGIIHKSDLARDTPYNTYTRVGLPPTPIALPGEASLMAAIHPAQSDALYFVARGDGSSQFSQSLDEHNRAVNKFIKGTP